MNPEKPSREEIEPKLTALLLGELPAEEAQLLRWAISQDAALAHLHDRLKLTVGLVREVAADPADATPAQSAPLKLSDEKREKLLAHFKTVAPKEFVPLVPPLPKRREISPLFAMAAALALIAVLAAMLLPALSSAKRKAQRVYLTSDKLALGTDQIAIGQNSPAAEKLLLTPPPAAPQIATSQRLPAKAYVANNGSIDSDVDAWRNQTAIVLPADGIAGEKQAANAWKKFTQLWTWDAQAGRVSAAVGHVLVPQNVNAKR